MDRASRAQIIEEDESIRARGAAVSAAEARDHLLRTPRQLPARYLYDALGSALFDAICQLPWYTIPRAESALLAKGAGAILPARGGFGRLVELGPGSGAKLATLLRARPGGVGGLEVHLIDVSANALDGARRAVEAAGVAGVATHAQTYEQGLRRALDPPGDRATLVLFLGSNIGNFDRSGSDALLRDVRSTLCEGDGLLLGADLVKPERELLLAYDDPIGVTAAFNRNVLHRVNRELDGTFQVSRFIHRAVWNERASRVEMHLVSPDRQDVQVRGAGMSFTLQPGEYIWTESSYKYTPDGLAALLEDAGLRVAEQWIDERHQFALTLARAAGPRAGRLLRRAGASTALEAALPPPRDP
jgi:dimethylhistidine N-methyltransferase